MAISNGDRFLIMIDGSYRFAQDEVILKIVKRTQDGLVPIKFTLTEQGVIPQDEVSDVEIGTPIPRELAELMLSAFGRYFLSTEGDLVLTNQRLMSELERVTKQLESLINGIGRLGSAR